MVKIISYPIHKESEGGVIINSTYNSYGYANQNQNTEDIKQVEIHPTTLWGYSHKHSDNENYDGDLTSSGTITSKDLHILNKAIFDKLLSVDELKANSATFEKDVKFNNNVFIAKYLNGTNANFKGDMNIQSNLHIGNNMLINGIVYANNNVNVKGSLSVDGTSVFKGNLSTSGNFSVEGNSVFNGTIYSNGKFIGKDAEIKQLKSENIQVENLNVSGSAHFAKLIIDQIKATEGNIIISPANAKLNIVEKDSNGIYTLYFLASDETNKKYNTFENDDLIYCQTFDASEGENYDISNKLYWSKVIEVSKKPIQKEYLGKQRYFHYIKIDFKDKYLHSNGVPAVGDNIVVLGNKSLLERQNAIMIGAYTNPLDADIKPPFFIQYEKINDYSLLDKRLTVFSNGYNRVASSTESEQTNSNTKNYDDVIEDLKLKFNGFTDKQKEFEKIISVLETTNKGLKSSVDGYKLQLDNQQKTIDTYHSELLQSKEGFQKNIETISNKIDGYSNTIQEQTKKINKVVENADNFQRTIQEKVDTKLNENQHQIDTLTSEVRQTKEGVNTQIEKFSKDLDNTNETFSLLTRQYGRFKETYLEFKNEIGEEITTKFNNQQSQIDSFNSQLKQTKDGFEKNIEAISKKVDSNTNNIVEQNRKYNEVKENVNEFQRTIGETINNKIDSKINESKQSIIKQTKDEIFLATSKSGLTITDDGIEIKTNKLKMLNNNNEDAMEVDENGNLSARSLSTMESGKGHMIINNAMTSFFGSNGSQIKFGIDDDGNPLMTFIDKNNVKRWELNIGGFLNSNVKKANFENIKVIENDDVLNGEWVPDFIRDYTFFDPYMITNKHHADVLFDEKELRNPIQMIHRYIYHGVKVNGIYGYDDIRQWNERQVAEFDNKLFKNESEQSPITNMTYIYPTDGFKFGMKNSKPIVLRKFLHITESGEMKTQWMAISREWYDEINHA